MKKILVGLLLAVTLVGALSMTLFATFGSTSRQPAALQGQLTDHCLHVGLVTVCYLT